MTRYLLDSSVFIEAKKHYYGFNFCPAFWWWLEAQIKQNKVASVEMVHGELIQKKDKLSGWAKNFRDQLFLKPDDDVLRQNEHIVAWVKREYEQTNHVKVFLDGADCWLIAHALVHGHTVVTQEIYSESKYNAKIPDVCDSFSVRCIDTFMMLDEGKAKFVLENR